MKRRALLASALGTAAVALATAPLVQAATRGGSGRRRYRKLAQCPPPRPGFYLVKLPGGAAMKAWVYQDKSGQWRSLNGPALPGDVLWMEVA
jgi:hypothetical protein